MSAQPNKQKIWKLSELITDTTPQPPAIIEGGILNSQSLLLVAGQPKAKKSFLAMNLAVAIAAGRSFACFTIRHPHTVLVLSAEGGFHSNKERIIRMCNSVPIPSDEMLRLNFDTRCKLDNDDDYKNLRYMIDDIEPDVIIIDPLVKFHGRDENSAQDMSIVLNRLRHIIEDKNVSIILIHHQGKNSASGARGSSAILGEYDSSIEIDKQKGKQQLKFDLRHAETPDPIDISFNAETFWFEAAVNTNPLITLLQANGELDRKTLALKLVEGGHYASDRSAQNKITKDKKSGVIVERHEKMCLP